MSKKSKRLCYGKECLNEEQAFAEGWRRAIETAIEVAAKKKFPEETWGFDYANHLRSLPVPEVE